MLLYSTFRLWPFSIQPKQSWYFVGTRKILKISVYCTYRTENMACFYIPRFSLHYGTILKSFWYDNSKYIQNFRSKSGIQFQNAYNILHKFWSKQYYQNGIVRHVPIPFRNSVFGKYFSIPKFQYGITM